MRPEQWDRARELFAEVVSVPEAERCAFLLARCGDDPEVLEETEALLGFHSDSFLDREKLIADLSLHTRETPPEAIAGFRVIREIGRGGMGIVYEAEQERPVRRKVAIKLIRAGMSSEQVVARFSAERQALAVMNHPGIARVFDAGATGDGRPYFVMELVEGSPITEFCDASRMPVKGRLELVVRVCDAVQHAHQKGIIHRDLKPSNVLVTLQDGVPSPKIIDFGIAKATDKGFTEATMLTELGQIVGTMGYMSPEQARMTGQGIDTRTDVYSLGVILYELLVGAPPFDPHTRETAFDELLRQIRDTDPPLPSARLGQLGGSSEEIIRNRQADPGSYMRDLRGDLDWIVMRSLEKEPDRRYSSASELAADIRRYLQSEPVVARPPGAGYRVGKFVRRHRVGVALTSVLALSLIGGIVGTSVSMVRARRAEADARVAEGVASAEAESASRVARYMVEIFKASDPGRTAGDVTLRELLDSRAATVREELIDEPRAQGRIMAAMGLAYTGIGAPLQALSLLKDALPILRGAYGNDHTEVYSDLNELGRLSNKLQDYEGAVRYFREALEIAQRIYEPDHEDLAPVMKNLAESLVKLGRIDEARPWLESALAIYTRAYGPDSSAVAQALSTNASLLREAGDTHGALEMATRSLEIRVRVNEPGNKSIGFGYFFLGEAQAAGGLPEEAITSFEAARGIWEPLYGPEHPDVGECHFEIAKVLLSLGRSEEAYAEYAKALAVMDAAFDTGSPETAASLARWYGTFSEFLAAMGRQGEAGALSGKADSLRGARSE
jgi:serine/threonine protein kinase/tetratricopeptide (TPR) repeat protein